MAALIRFALTQRVLILLAVLLMIGVGYSAYLQIPIDAFPDVSPTQVKVIVKSPGMTPEEVERRITIPIELELLGIPRQTMLRSVAKYALTDITVDFAEGTDIYWARQQITERLSQIWPKLPTGLEGGIAPMTTPLGEMFMFTVEGGDLDLMQRRSLLDWVIRPALRTVPGVADVNVLGGLVKAFEVKIDNPSMVNRGLSIDRVVEALRRNNRNDGAGRIVEGEEALLVRAEGRIKTLPDLREIVVAETDGIPIRIGDIAEVRIGSLTRYGAVSQNGQGESVEGLVLSLPGANTQQTIAGIVRKLDQIAPSLPPGVSIDVFYNRATLVSKAIATVTKALLAAIVLVLILLFLFLGDFRASITVALVLPLAALSTFSLMRFAGLSANLMSLGGLAIAIGMLVDAAVVVVENISSNLSSRGRSNQLPRLHVIYRATREVALPVTSGILIIVVVFLPLVTLQGLEGKLFQPVAQTIVFALAGSLILSFTVIPVLSSYWLKDFADKDPWLPRTLRSMYRPALLWCLRNSSAVTIAVVILLAVALIFFSQIGRTFMPVFDEGDIIVQVEKLPSVSLDQSVAIDLQIEKNILVRVPEVTRIVARVGSDEIGLDPMGANETDLFMVLAAEQGWRMPSKQALIAEIRKVMDELSGVAYGFTQPIEMRVAEMLTGERGDLVVKVFGPDLAELNQTAKQIAGILQQIRGARDVFTSRNEGMQYWQISLDRLAIGRLGLDADGLEEMLRSQIEGLRVGIIQENHQRTPLIVRGSVADGDLENLQIALPGGGQVPLTSVAHLDRVEGIVSVARERGQRFVVVRCNVRDRDLVSFVDESRNAVNRQIKLPVGYSIEWGGQYENQQRATARLALVIPISLGLVFLLLFSTFRSLRQAILVFTNIPLAIIGGVLALWQSGEYLSVPASVGFIALLGIAVLNGVVMLSCFNQLRASGLSMLRVVVTGSMRRLRPVLMTAGTTAFALIPLLFATGPGSEIQRPLAVVVIGGLITSTLLTLILLPILYRRFAEPIEKDSCKTAVS